MSEQDAAKQEPCQRIVCVGVSPTPWVRCGLPEDSEMHDPLGPFGRHVYDPAPAQNGGSNA